ncbi:MAG: hypothetical protein II007_11035 [Gammaproteobacteria bacterium]|nr:hypothetical protein [Gammaproteobacteria bacterium]
MGVINGSSATLGSASITNDLTVGRDVVARNLSLTGNLTMQPGSTLNAGNGRLQSLVVSGTSTLNNLTVSNDMSIGGQLTAGGLVSNGNAHIKGNALVDGDLTVVGLSTMSGVRVGGAQVIGADGTLYQGGIKISDLFLGKTAKAADADLLDGIDSGSFARRDAPNTFTGSNVFNSRTDLNGGTYAGNKMVISGDGNTLYEGGVSLSTKYLGKNDKATDADRLDGIDSNLFARRDTANTFTGTNTFNGRIDLNGGTYAGGKLVISADGNVLYEAGQALSARYLGINAKAKDADLLDGQDSSYYLNASNFNAGTLARARLSGTYDISITGSAANAGLLDGIDSSSFARRDAPNTFTSANTFNGTVTTAGLLDVNNGIDVSGAATFRNGQNITGNVSIAGSLTVGAATFTGLTVNGTLTANAVNSLGDVTSKSGSITYSLNTVAAWREACRADPRSAACGMALATTVAWGDMPAGATCGMYMQTQGVIKANVPCQGMSPISGCPSGFYKADLGYFEAGNGSRAFVTCVKGTSALLWQKTQTICLGGSTNPYTSTLYATEQTGSCSASGSKRSYKGGACGSSTYLWNEYTCA